MKIPTCRQMYLDYLSSDRFHNFLYFQHHSSCLSNSPKLLYSSHSHHCYQRDAPPFCELSRMKSERCLFLRRSPTNKILSNSIAFAPPPHLTHSSPQTIGRRPPPSNSRRLRGVDVDWARGTANRFAHIIGLPETSEQNPI